MRKRLNILLPETTLETIDRLTKPGERSRFIDKAVQHYVSHQSTEALRSRLEQTAVRDQDIDRQVAEDWVAVDHEAWQQLDHQPTRAASKPVTRGEAKSTSRRSTPCWLS
ncbi:MAG: hypothetical protein M3Y27_07710 [Acidobacteriota bacterium]|nr:hypothetical protein [Acidobacteriota bacterium]